MYGICINRDYISHAKAARYPDWNEEENNFHDDL